MYEMLADSKPVIIQYMEINGIFTDLLYGIIIW